MFRRRLLVLLLASARCTSTSGKATSSSSTRSSASADSFPSASQSHAYPRRGRARLRARCALEALIVVSHGALDPGAPLLRAGDAVLMRPDFSRGRAPIPSLRDAGWAEYLRFQLSGVFFRYADLLTTAGRSRCSAMFLVGLWVGRSGMLRRSDTVAADAAAGAHVGIRIGTSGRGGAGDVDAAAEPAPTRG